jgi:vacuolar protein sorting-associated protein 41
MISGIVPHPMTLPLAVAASPGITTSTAPTSFLLLAYTPPDTSILANADESPADHEQQARKAAERPELRIVSRAGKELAADALGVAGYRSYGCNDYVLGVVPDPEDTTVGVGRVYVVLSPKDIVLVRPRDRRDRVAWLVERKRYEEALEEVERMEEHERGDEIDVLEIGQRYVEHLVGEGELICYWMNL